MVAGPEVVGAVKGGKKMLAPAIAGVGITAVAALKPVLSIQENEIGIRTRHKSAVKRGALAALLEREGDFYGILRKDNGMLGTGTHFKLSHGVKILSLADKTNDPKTIKIDTAEGEQLDYVASFTWAISDEEDEYPYLALTAIEDGLELASAVDSMCLSGLRAVTNRQPREYIEDEDQVFTDLVDYRQERLYDSYGVRIVRMNLETTTESESQVLAKPFHRIADALLGSSNGSQSNGSNAEIMPAIATFLEKRSAQA